MSSTYMLAHQSLWPTEDALESSQSFKLEMDRDGVSSTESSQSDKQIRARKMTS